VSGLDFTNEANTTANDSRLISLTFDVQGDAQNANAGYKKIKIGTAGTPNPGFSLVFYAPTTIIDAANLTVGCNATITNGILYRYGTSSYEDAEPAIWNGADLTVNGCTFTLDSAGATSATEVQLTFNRPVAGTPAPSDFAITDSGGGSLAVSAVSVTGNTVTLTTAAQTGGEAYTVNVTGALKDDIGDDLSVTSATFSGFVTPAQVVINELNANIGGNTGHCDLIELRVTSGGSMAGYLLRERDSGSLVTFPAGFSVATNDIIVVHMGSTYAECNSNGATSEVTAKDEGPATTYPENYDSAWDFWSTDTGLTNTDNVFTLYDALGNIMDAVLSSDDPTGTAAAASERQAATVADANQWQMVGGGVPSGGFVDDNFSAWAVQDLNGTGNDASGDTIQRTDNTDSNDMSGWGMAASSWGVLNAGQTAL
jgi:hypothetical protein